jgi:diguanylate cyclase (GGDEF)-like protein
MVGDEVLAQIGHHLRDHIRQPDRAGRYGGEEFLILLPNTAIKSAAVAASRLCNEIRTAKMRAAANSIQLTVSIGIAELAVGSETWQKLLTRADQAMYQAKTLGRDQWAASPNK